jgi:cytochrome c-type biogenesis protein CcmH/NrfG
MAAIREVLGRQTVATQEPGADGAAEQDPDEGDAAPTTTGLAPAETGAGAAESAGEEAATDDAGGDGRSAPGFVYAVVAAAVLVAGAGVFRAVRMRAGG